MLICLIFLTRFSYLMVILLIGVHFQSNVYLHYLVSNYCIQNISSWLEVDCCVFLICVLFEFFICFSGNHESETMNQMYGFDGEVKAKYTAQMAELFTEVYNWLPLAHCLNNKVLVRSFLFLIIHSSF